MSELGIELPAVRPPGGTFVHAVRSGSLLFLGGQLPWRPDGSLVQGKLGADLDAEAGNAAARLAGLCALSTMAAQPGGFAAIRRLVKVYGVVNATPDFMLHTQVINGASDLFVEVFGEAGQHVRLAVGVSSLPFNMALEIELVAEVSD